ncbi:MAG: histone-like nucleoid-structuring protein Lsr2 [Candidatus Binatia bacterium]
MAQKIEVTVLSDLSEVGGATTAEFALDGTNYEIDLTDDEKAALTEALADYITAARKTIQRSGRTPKSAASASKSAVFASKSSAPRGLTATDKELRGAIRAWFAEQGCPIGDRGRISDQDTSAYDAQDVTISRAYQLRNDARIPVVESGGHDTFADDSDADPMYQNVFSG